MPVVACVSGAPVSSSSPYPCPHEFVAIYQVVCAIIHFLHHINVLFGITLAVDL